MYTTAPAAAHAATHQAPIGHQPTAPTEGAAVHVRYARLGTPGEVGEVWCPGIYLRTIGHGADKRYLVKSTTPRSPFPATVPATPDSVRFVQQPQQVAA